MTENDFRNRIIESNLTPNARLVCYVLLQYRNRKSGDCYPSQVTIAESCGLCRNSISRAIKELEGEGYMDIKKKRLKGQKFTSCFYIFSFQCNSDEQSNELSNELSNECSNDVSYECAPDEHKPSEPIEPIKPIKSKPKPHRIPDDWECSLDLGEWAMEHGLSRESVCKEEEAFIDHWKQAVKGNTSLNWDLKFRTWIRNAKKWKDEK